MDTSDRAENAIAGNCAPWINPLFEDANVMYHLLTQKTASKYPIAHFNSRASPPPTGESGHRDCTAQS
jgi:hypothetical protein